MKRVEAWELESFQASVPREEKCSRSHAKQVRQKLNGQGKAARLNFQEKKRTSGQRRPPEGGGKGGQLPVVRGPREKEKSHSVRKERAKKNNCKGQAVRAGRAARSCRSEGLDGLKET